VELVQNAEVLTAVSTTATIARGRPQVCTST